MDALTLYLITIASSISVLFALMAIGAALTAAVCAIIYMCNIDFEEKTAQMALSLSVKCVIVGVVAGFISAVIPSTRSLYTMVAVYEVTNTEGASKLPKNLVDAANSFLTKLKKDAEE
jgi:hypothetical protein